MTAKKSRKPSLQKLKMWQKMLLSMAAGLLCGLLAAQAGPEIWPPGTLAQVTEWVMLPARIFLALISMIVIPLVFCSILLAVTGGGSVGFLKEAGSRICLYFVGTTAIAVSLGIFLSLLIDPAAYMPAAQLALMPGHDAASALAAVSGTQTSLPQMIVSLIPVNIAQAVLGQEMMQIVIAALIAGIALLSLPVKQAFPLTALSESVQALCMKVVSWAMALAPVAVFGFLFRMAVETGTDALHGMAAYIATVLLGLLCLLGLYLAVVKFVARRDPLVFLRDVRDAQTLAFSSSSSAATMPLSLETAEKKLGVRPEIARLVVPLGATINMDGTAIYQVIVALFLTRLLGIDLTVVQMLVLSVTIIGASIGSPGTPGVGLVILATVLQKLGVPAESIGIILGVDRLLDMCRTTINVTGDLTAAVVMERWVRKPAQAAGKS